ncbi:MAG: amidase [Bacteriovoracaceae bacterium]
MKYLSLLILLSLNSSCFHIAKALPSNFAKEYCSCRFVMNQTDEYCEDYVTLEQLQVGSYEVDEERKIVRARWLGVESEAMHYSKFSGCGLSR